MIRAMTVVSFLSLVVLTAPARAMKMCGYVNQNASMLTLTENLDDAESVYFLKPSTPAQVATLRKAAQSVIAICMQGSLIRQTGTTGNSGSLRIDGVFVIQPGSSIVADEFH